MKKLIIVLLGLTIFLMNVVLGNECAQPHTTHNVGHQFYEALVETPKDAIVGGATAIGHLGKDVAAAVATSNAPHELKDAAKELVIQAPKKTAEAVKNGAVKAYEGTKNGAKAVYNVAIKMPARKIKNVAEQVVHSDFVQGTKEAVVDIGQQIAEAGHDAVDATKHGAHKVYHVMIEKPVGAVKAAAHYLVHGDTQTVTQSQNDTQCISCQTCVMILPAPVMTAKSLEYYNDNVSAVTAPNITTIAVMPSSWVQGSVQMIAPDTRESLQEEIDIEFLMDTPCQLNDENYSLSENTLNQLAKAYQSVQADLVNHK